MPLGGETLTISGTVSDVEIPSGRSAFDLKGFQSDFKQFQQRRGGLDFPKTRRTQADFDVHVDDDGLAAKNGTVLSLELTKGYMQGLYQLATELWKRPKNVSRPCVTSKWGARCA